VAPDNDGKRYSEARSGRIGPLLFNDAGRPGHRAGAALTGRGRESRLENDF
jgi:hypothetical protein